MIKFFMPRGSGKTHQLIKLSHKSGDYIVCSTMSEVARVSAMAAELNMPIPFPLTYHEFIKKEYGSKGIKGFLIDDVDRLVEYMSEVPVNAITICI